MGPWLFGHGNTRSVMRNTFNTTASIGLPELAGRVSLIVSTFSCIVKQYLQSYEMCRCDDILIGSTLFDSLSFRSTGRYSRLSMEQTDISKEDIDWLNNLVASRVPRMLQDEVVSDCLYRFASTFSKAFRETEPKNIRGWLRHAVEFAIIDARRSSAKYFRMHIELVDFEPPYIPNLDGGPVSDGNCERPIRDALTKLSPEQAEMIRLHFFDGMTTSDASAAAGVSRSTGKSRLTRALCRLSCDQRLKQAITARRDT